MKWTFGGGRKGRMVKVEDRKNGRVESGKDDRVYKWDKLDKGGKGLERRELDWVRWIEWWSEG